ncbi:unnamed protein product [Blepharisma stoltei]|uniref:Uncharacterized protein n=1 Tax=Blepharisma stoltei TaxID=1481888 RepID=A0AAU9J210_9CILI|nr:unnamed protein product [Blepharisma stoltei]
MSLESKSDSNDYLDDFESDSERSSTDNKIPTNLFDALELALGSEELMNYCDSKSIEKKPKIYQLLTKISCTKFEMVEKIKNQILERKSALLEREKWKIPKSIKNKFKNFLIMLTAKGRLETQASNKYTKQILLKTISESRKWIFSAISDIEKGGKIALSNIEMKRVNLRKKSSTLLEKYLWARQIFMMKCLRNKSYIIKELEGKQKIEYKKFFEANSKSTYLTGEVLSIEYENLNQKYQGYDCCQVLDSFSAITSIFANNQMLKQPKSNQESDEILFPNSTYLSRAFLEKYRKSTKMPLTLHIYADTREEFANYDFSKPIIIETYECLSTILHCYVKRKAYTLELAQIKHLSNSLDGSSCSKTLFVLDTSSIYESLYFSKIEIRKLTEIELEELKYIYLNKKNKLEEIQREVGALNDDKIGLIREKNSKLVRSILIQLKNSVAPTKPRAKSIPNLCNWEGCSSKINVRPDFEVERSLILADGQEMWATKRRASSPAGKRKPWKQDKKSLPKLEEISKLCQFHSNLRNAINLPQENSIFNDYSKELSKACESGLNWQDELNKMNKIKQLTNDSAKQVISEYFSEVTLSLSKRVEGASSFKAENRSEYKERMLKEIEELKNLRNIEHSATEELKRIKCSENKASIAFNNLSTTLMDAFSSTPAVKLAKLMTLNDQLLSSKELRRTVSGADKEVPYSHRKFIRPPTAPINNSKDATPRIKRKLQIQDIQAILSSPYLTSQTKFMKKSKKKPRKTVLSSISRTRTSPNTSTRSNSISKIYNKVIL